MDTTKISLNLTPQNWAKLEEIRERKRIPNSKTINALISTFIGISEETKNELLMFLTYQNSKTMSQFMATPDSEPFHKEKYRMANDEYLKMLQFFKGEVHAKTYEGCNEK